MAEAGHGPAKRRFSLRVSSLPGLRASVPVRWRGSPHCSRLGYVTNRQLGSLSLRHLGYPPSLSVNSDTDRKRDGARRGTALGSQRTPPPSLTQLAAHPAGCRRAGPPHAPCPPVTERERGRENEKEKEKGGRRGRGGRGVMFRDRDSDETRKETRKTRTTHPRPGRSPGQHGSIDPSSPRAPREANRPRLTLEARRLTLTD